MQKSGEVTIHAPPTRRGRGRPRAFDREKALGAATNLFWRNGYEATSIADLTAVMGIGTKSLYAAFGSKEALFAEALQHYYETYAKPGWTGFDAATTAREAARTFLYDSAAALSGAVSDRPRGCMLAIASVGCEGLPALNAFAQSIQGTFERLEERFRKGVADGELEKPLDASRLAKFVETIQYGMTIQARGGAGRAELEGVADVAMAAWDGIAGSAHKA